jgi:hypothetical protein
VLVATLLTQYRWVLFERAEQRARG